VHHGEIIGCVALDASNGAGTKLKSVIEPEDGKYMLIEWADIIWRRITGKKAEVKAERNTLESTSDTSTTVKPSSSLRNRKQTVKCTSTASTVPSGACTVAHIRHLYVDQVYRRHHCATDLVNSALESAFVQASKDGTRLERAIIKLPGYSGEGAKVLLARMGFKDVQLADDWVREGRKVGGDGWLEVDERVVLGAATFKARWLELTRQEWEERMKVTGR
jgi:N-acetylglutamate synthase-like GNAT family acetyltransferase